MRDARCSSRQLARNEQHGVAVRGEFGDQRVDLGLGADVDATRRLIENQQLTLRGEPLASTSFCWLPPESPAARVHPGARTRSRSSRLPQGALGPSRGRAWPLRAKAELPASCSRSDASESTSPWRLRSSGTRPMPRRMASRGERSTGCLHEDLSVTRRRGRKSRAPLPNGPRQRDPPSRRLPRCADENDTSWNPAGLESPSRANARARRRRVHQGKVFGELAADHHLDDLPVSSAGGRPVATWRPSRNTVIVSHSRKFSSIRCVT